MLNKFFSLFYSNDSYHQSNISVMSAANRLCNRILGAIYYKSTYWIGSITKNKVIDPEQTKPTPSITKKEEMKEEITSTSSGSTSSDKKTENGSDSSNKEKSKAIETKLESSEEENEVTERKVKVIKESISDRTSKNEDVHPLLFPTNKASHPGEDKLQKLLSTSSLDKKFPEDYANELNQFHKMQFKNSGWFAKITWFIKKRTLCVDDTIKELQTPITNLLQLREMQQKWFLLQEIWGNDFDDIYCITKIEEGNGTATFQELFTHEYNDEALQKYLAVKARQGGDVYDSVYKWKVKQILRTPEGLKNLILMFGLEHSFIAKTGGACKWQRAHHTPKFQLNSAINILNDEYCTQALIKIPLIHLAVAKGILPEVSFLLTQDNVNCTSYQGLHHVPQKPTPRQEESGMVLQNTLVILDTPLKIAIDNFDDTALQLLIDHNADVTIKVRPRLVPCDATPVSNWDYYVPHSVTPCQPLCDYFLTKTPKVGHKTTSYIKIANLLYSYLGSEAVSSFLQTCESKKITVDGQEKNLIECINSPQPTKSANTDTTSSQNIQIQTQQVDKIKAPAVTKTELDPTTLLHTSSTDDTNIELGGILEYESHVNFPVYQAFSSLNQLTIEYY